MHPLSETFRLTFFVPYIKTETIASDIPIHFLFQILFWVRSQHLPQIEKLWSDEEGHGTGAQQPV